MGVECGKSRNEYLRTMTFPTIPSHVRAAPEDAGVREGSSLPEQDENRAGNPDCSESAESPTQTPRTHMDSAVSTIGWRAGRTSENVDSARTGAGVGLKQPQSGSIAQLLS
jgi:hypothetical protein